MEMIGPVVLGGVVGAIVILLGIAGCWCKIEELAHFREMDEFHMKELEARVERLERARDVADDG